MSTSARTHSVSGKCVYQPQLLIDGRLGALDGKHIEIKKPARSGTQFCNYKKYFSIVLLAVCDSENKFVYVDIGSYGSESDGGVFNRSTLKRGLTNGTLNLPSPADLPGTTTPSPYFFVADAAFPLMENLMKPFPGYNLSVEQTTFNYR